MSLLAEPTRQMRSRHANAVRHGDTATAAEVDVQLRAGRIARAIRLATENRPPLPPEVIDALRDLLPPANPSSNPSANPSEKG